MARKRRVALLGAALLAAVLGVIMVRGMLARPAAAAQVSAAAPRRDGGDGTEAPALSLDVNSPTCYLPVPATAACYIEWNYLGVTAVPGSYVISMTVAIDDRLRAYHAGFFQTAMIIPSDMTRPGYKVTCGAPGSGGLPEWGASYRYTVRARDTSGQTAASVGTVTCPADVTRAYLPLVRKE